MIAHPSGASIQENVQAVKMFSYDDVKNMTNTFEEKIGEGAFGPVYKGKLANGKQVAVKRNSRVSEQGQAEFSKEVRVLSRIHHRNLVSLLGFCAECEERILVYELVDGGAHFGVISSIELGTIQVKSAITKTCDLPGRKKTPHLDWPTRLRIAIDAARGLEYLHNDCHPKVIHRDLKSNNIMLDMGLEVKLIDFGLSKIYKDSIREGMGAEPEHSEVKGTHGYRDPEYQQTGRPTFKSDVYAFGVVLMELISGDTLLHLMFGKHSRVDSTIVGVFRKVMSSNRLGDVMDKELGENYDTIAMHKVADLAMRCVNDKSEDRPDMRQVVRDLVEIRDFHGIWTETGFQNANSSFNAES